MNLDRLEKLLALTRSPNQHEAAAAALKLCALITDLGGIRALAHPKREPSPYELYVRSTREARAAERASSRRPTRNRWNASSP